MLLAKIQVAIRRVYGEYANESTIIESMGGIKLNKDTFKMIYNQIEIELSKNELKLLSMLIKNENKIVSREELLEELWDDTLFVDDNTLTVNIARIRSKLKELGVSEVISTKRGIGYMFQSKYQQEAFNMNKKILINFVQDKLSFTIGYCLNTILILVYVYSLGAQIDMLYPLLLSIVIYCFQY